MKSAETTETPKTVVESTQNAPENLQAFKEKTINTWNTLSHIDLTKNDIDNTNFKLIPVAGKKDMYRLESFGQSLVEVDMQTKSISVFTTTAYAKEKLIL